MAKYTGERIEFVLDLLEANKGISITEACKLMCENFDLEYNDKNKESVRKSISSLVNKHRKNKQKDVRVLVIGDIHAPFDLDGYLKHCKNTYKQYNCNKVIFIGDIIDNHFSSYHETDADGMGGGDELEFAIKRIQKYYKAFPKADVIIGNHDRIISRKAQTGGIPKKWIRSYSEVLNTPNWNFTERVVYNDVQYIHGEAGTARTKSKADLMSTVQGHLHCVPLSYEVSTKDGWKKLSDITLEDKVLCYGKSGEICYSKVNAKKSGIHSGKVYKFNNKLLKQLVTSEHNMYTKDHEYLPISDFLNKKTSSILTKALPYNNECEENYSDDLLRFIIALCADGYYDTSNSVINFRFHLKKDRKIKRLNEILFNLGEKLSWTKQKKGSYKSSGFSLDFRKKVSKILPKKELPKLLSDLNSRQNSIVIKELSKWDGSSNNRNRVVQFCSTKKSELDLVQEILLKGGLVSKKYKHCISWIDSQRGSNNKISKQKGSWINLDSPLDVGCISTDFNNFFIRTDEGTVELTGNSQMYVEWIVGANYRIFCMQVGCGIDFKKYAFGYAKAGKKPAIGCGVVLGKDVAINVPMKL